MNKNIYILVIYEPYLPGRNIICLPVYATPIWAESVDSQPLLDDGGNPLLDNPGGAILYGS